jgi:SAM-dependent methyltransferase
MTGAVARDEFRTLARNWEVFGEDDPLFAVLSDPTKHGGKWEVDDFFASGRAHVEKLFRQLDGVPFESDACLDFGCGVGRLTIPLSARFTRTVGVDVARSMIDRARRFGRQNERLEFVVNRHPDLRPFRDATFDFVYSCLVLQHMPPDVALRYIGEFFRVSRPGGLVVFQVPAEGFSESAISARYALPDSGYAARLAILASPTTLRPGESGAIRVQLVNQSDVVWRHDIPAGRHITIANHWLRADGGVAIPDDGRTLLPATLAPNEHVEAILNVRAPSESGRYWVEIDLVQEQVCWFAQRGSATARAAIDVEGAPVPTPPNPAPAPARRPSLVQRARRRLRGGTPTFEMFAIPRGDVEEAIRAAGGNLVLAIDDNAAGHRWLSYTYVCRTSA